MKRTGPGGPKGPGKGAGQIYEGREGDPLPMLSVMAWSTEDCSLVWFIVHYLVNTGTLDRG